MKFCLEVVKFVIISVDLTMPSGSGTQAVLINSDAYARGKKTTTHKNKLERVGKEQTFIELFNLMVGKCDVVYKLGISSIKVFISSTTTPENEIDIDLNKTLFFAEDFIQDKSVYFLANRKVIDVDKNVERNAFELMMRISDGQQPMKGDDMRVKLHNDVLVDMQSGGSLLRSNVIPSEGEKILKKSDRCDLIS